MQSVAFRLCGEAAPVVVRPAVEARNACSEKSQVSTSDRSGMCQMQIHRRFMDECAGRDVLVSSACV